MLTEISCDKYRDNGVERGPIRLHAGLNVVVGGDDASNSIGKTTFLLAIDFALGGDSYASKKSSMKRRIGPHEVFFTHSFEGDQDYRFCRSTADYNTVWRCDDTGALVSSMTIGAFRDWLAAKYDLGELGSSFRNLQSPFLRVYGLKHEDVDRPLMANGNDSLSDDLHRLLHLYGCYKEVADIEERKEKLDDDKKAFQNARNRKFIRGAETRAEYEENERKIARLETQMKEILQSCERGAADFDLETENYIAELSEELVVLKRSRAALRRNLAAMERDLSMIDFRKTKDFERLLEFFPGFNIKHLEEIEAFHAENVKNLREQHREESADMRDRINNLDIQIDRIELAIKNAGAAPSLPRTTIQSYADINSYVEQLRHANELYDQNQQFKIDAAAIMQERETVEMGHYNVIQQRINDELKKLNDQATGGGISAPRIEIQNPDRYSYEVRDDDGTGSRNRGMFLFDVALLNQTPLKFVIHDSPGIKQVEDGHTIGMFEIYSQLDKQVFIAIDKADKFTESGQVPSVITENTVLKLDRGHELFGEAWNREQND